MRRKHNRRAVIIIEYKRASKNLEVISKQENNNKYEVEDYY